MPVILATQESEIRRITVQSQPQANSSQDSILKNPSQKRGTGDEMTQTLYAHINRRKK
jgi:hypothetical protein